MGAAAKWLGAAVVAMIIMAACASEASPLALGEYVVALQEIETEFVETAPNPAEVPEDRDQFPVGGDLTVASILYMEFDERLAGWRSIEPPSSLRGEHAELVDALDVVQREVGKYLAKSATETADFDFDTIGPVVGPLLRDATVACRRLDSAIRELGAAVEFAEDCDF